MHTIILFEWKGILKVQKLKIHEFRQLDQIILDIKMKYPGSTLLKLEIFTDAQTTRIGT